MQPGQANVKTAGDKKNLIRKNVMILNDASRDACVFSENGDVPYISRSPLFS